MEVVQKSKLQPPPCENSQLKLRQLKVGTFFGDCAF